MCELLGFTASKKTDISAYLKAFYAHSVTNPHGWGMMYEDGVRVILKEAVSLKAASRRTENALK
jgi:glutamine amidotransferase